MSKSLIRRPGWPVRIMGQLALWAGLCALAPQAGADELARLQAKARDMKLAQTPLWQSLLHYEPNQVRSGVHSQVVSRWFFLSEQGRTEPRAELEATLAGLFSARKIGPRELPAYCLFVARRKFLVRELDIDTRHLPVNQCPTYEKWRRAIAPRSASLVFPTAYANSPPSMFGHTLLRVDSAQQRKKNNELLSYAINYAAATPGGEQPLDFAWKGLTGGYPGLFGMFPYYKKVKQYSAMENRDIWSYPLHLRRVQIERMMDHVWEMEQAQFNYYFLNKNCSYQLLSLIDVAQPGLELTRRFDWYAIPSDTIRALDSVPGLMGEGNYRPSAQTRLNWQSRSLSGRELELAQRIAHGHLAPDDARLRELGPRRRAAVLEVAHDALDYQVLAGDDKARVRDKKTVQERADRILAARAAIAQPSPFGRMPVPDTSPRQAHGSLRARLAGVYADSRYTMGLRVRPGYHDLLDDPRGFNDGLAIDLVDLGLRLDPVKGRLKVDDIRLLSVTSLGHWDAWQKPMAFNLDTGARRRPSGHVFTHRRNDLGYYLQGGPGLSFGNSALTAYVLSQFSVDANPGLQHDWALGTGGSAGLLASPWPGMQLQLSGGWLHYAAGARGHYGWSDLGVQLPLARDQAWRMSLGYENSRVADGMRVDWGIQAYF